MKAKFSSGVIRSDRPVKLRMSENSTVMFSRRLSSDPSGRLDPDLAPLQPLQDGGARAVDEHGDEDDRADDQRVEVRIGVEHDQAVLDGLDQHGAEHRADHAATAAEQAGAA